MSYIKNKTFWVENAVFFFTSALKIRTVFSNILTSLLDYCRNSLFSYLKYSVFHDQGHFENKLISRDSTLLCYIFS
jgi:hypothetical protein